MHFLYDVDGKRLFGSYTCAFTLIFIPVLGEIGFSLGLNCKGLNEQYSQVSNS